MENHNETYYYYYYDDNYDQWADRTHMMYKVAPPILLLIGTIVSVLTIIVLIKMRSDTSAFPLLFMALTITDLLLLYLWLLRRWIAEQFEKWVIDTGEGACKFWTWMEYCMVSLSAWFLAAMTVYRAMTIVWPIQMRRMRPRIQALVTIVILIASSFLFNSSVLYGMTTRDHIVQGLCYWKTSFEDKIRPVLDWLEIIVNAILPSAVMIMCSCLMIRAVMQSAERTRSRSSDVAGSSTEDMTVHQVTVTLIVVSLTFILLTLPYYAMQIVIQSKPDLNIDRPFYFWINFTRIMWVTNSAIKFFLYILTWSRFREEAKKLFMRSQTPASQSNSTTDSSLKATTSV